MLTERWVFPAVPDAVAQARRAAREIAERHAPDASVLSMIVLCVSEAVTNVVAHAYRHEPEPGQVEIEARRPAGGLCLSVRDHGCGMAPRGDSPGAGLGLGLIERIASRTAIAPVSPRGTQLVMRFDVDERAAS
jgi:anti-sigma regulatory factor (Ser/Thr protein kinase)